MNKKERLAALEERRVELGREITRTLAALRRRVERAKEAGSENAADAALVDEIAKLQQALDALRTEREAVDIEMRPLNWRTRRTARRKRAKAKKRKKIYQEVVRTKVSGGLPGLGKRR